MKILFCLLSAVITFIASSRTSCPCRPVQFQYGINCECTEKYCDSLYIREPKNKSKFLLVTSSKQGDRFSYIRGHFSTKKCSKPKLEENILWINQKIRHKRSKIIGFGGAFTGSVTYILSRFSPKLRSNFYQSYFSMDCGIGYNMMRIPIGGTDFDLEPWAYDMQSENDTMLTHFTELDYRDKIRNAFIRELQQCTENDEMKLLASAWSPPLWMKAKHEWYGAEDNRLIPAFYQSWADYHGKWLNMMEEDGVSIWGITTGNEPSYAVLQQYGFEALSWDPGNQAEWFVDNLVPALDQSGNAHIKVGIFDDTRNVALEYLNEMVKRRPNVMEFTDFIAIHGYSDNVTSPDILNTLYERYGKRILYDEMSFGVFEPTLYPGSWSVGEQLITFLMGILQHDVAGYIDWNMILDSKGGPAYLGETLDAFIFANENYTAFYKQPLYYVMAHFARFIPACSIRIDSMFVGPSKSRVETVAYRRPDRRISVILYNKDDTIAVPITLIDATQRKTNLLLKPKSLNTFIYSY